MIPFYVKMKHRTIYITDDGCPVCCDCAPSSGHDTMVEAPISMADQWQAEFGEPLKCECGKVIYLKSK